MRVCVRVQPNAKVEKVERMPDGVLKVWVRAKPVEGEATRACLEAVAGFLGVKRSCVSLVSGAASRDKVLDVID